MKSVKRVAALLVVLVLALSLCGCESLDRMRAEQGLQRSPDEIELGGKTYRFVRYELMQDYSPFIGYQRCYITDADVPVLLSRFMGLYGGLSEEVLEVSGNYYVLADRYDFYNREHTLDRMGFAVSGYDQTDGTYYDKLVLLTEEEQATLQSETTLVSIPNAAAMCRFYWCDEATLFVRDGFNLCLDEYGHYYREDPNTGGMQRYDESAEPAITALIQRITGYHSTDEFVYMDKAIEEPTMF